MKKIVVGIIAVLSIWGLAACGTKEEPKKAGSHENQSTEMQIQDKIEVTDQNGTVRVPINPQKVIVFDNSALDTMDALDVGDKVIAAATNSIPDYIKRYSNVESAGGIKEPDLEKINQLQPDLIIISGRQRDFQDALEKIAPTIYLAVNHEDPWNSSQQNIKTLGRIFEKEAEADTHIAELQAKIDTLHDQAADSGKKALVLLANEGNISAYGSRSRFGIIHDTFGFLPVEEKIEASTHGQSVSYEYILKKNPDILFVIDRTKAIGGDISQNNLMDNELVKQTKAGQTNNVISLDPQVWYLAGSGIESIQIMIDNVGKALD